MSWEDVAQPAGGSMRAPVSASLKAGVGGHTRLTLTISPEVEAQLRWSLGERLALQVGRAEHAGLARITPAPHGRPLRMIPRSGFRMATLVPPDDLARWNAPQQAVTEWRVVPNGKGGGTLELRLPWDLTGDPPADEEPEAA